MYIYRHNLQQNELCVMFLEEDGGMNTCMVEKYVKCTRFELLRQRLTKS